jgi:hypothetical protein
MIAPRRIVSDLGAVSLAVVLVLFVGTVDADVDEPLHDDDVVRMLVAGTPVDEIIERIGTSQVEFDLSEEMLGELAAAGVPTDVIDAMKARQAELAPPEEPVGDEADDDATPSHALRIHLNPGKTKKKARSIEISDEVDPGLAAEWRLSGAEERTFDDIAIYVACTTPYHVPDHWRTKSPMGRDFFSMPRHKMLAFVPGAEWEKAGFFRGLGIGIPNVSPSGTAGSGAASTAINTGAPKSGRLEYEIPPAIEIDLAPSETHDILLGVAVKAGDRFYRFVDDVMVGVALGDADAEVRAFIEGTRDLATLTVYFEASEEDPEGEEDSSADAE